MTEPIAGRDWLLDELAHAGAEHLDQTCVAGYDDKAAFDPAPDLEALAARGLDGRSVLVDLGCGTGTFTLAAARRCRSVVAVDVSASMLAVLARKLEAERIGNVERVHAGFLTYEHAGEPADVIYTRNVLHHLPDFWKGIALSRLASVLKPGGVLWLRDLVYCFEPGETVTAVESWLEHGAESSRRGWTREELAEHVRGEYSTFAWLLEPLIEHAGFRIESVDVDRRRTYARYECIRR